MRNEIKKHYIENRLSTVDSDFLSFEENMVSSEDLNTIHDLLRLREKNPNYKYSLPNPHNSILLYVCGITDEFDFQKQRSDFIGGSPPDIDIDHDALDRDKAIQWAVDYWGRENVANIITHGKFKPKSLTRSFYRVTEGPANDLQYILKNIPPPKYGKEASLAEIIDKVPELSTEEKYSDYYKFAFSLENLIANFGIHAAGIVISDFPIRDVVPVWKNSKAERITQFDMKEVESLGLIKFDFLSIDTLSIIKETLRLILETKNISIVPYEIKDGDEKTYKMLHEGLLTGVFQMETSGMAKHLISRIKPRTIEELSDISALNRPGPLQAKLDKLYIDNKNNKYPPDTLPEELAKILESSYWTIIYQEQVMSICSDLAGFTQKESDDIRRAMGKKNVSALSNYKIPFIKQCSERTSLSQDYAENLWDELLGFADYCFNKAHSVSYSMLTYISGYLKANYPVEFFAALMTVRSKTLQPKLWAQKAPEYIQEAKKLGVFINPPSVNGSSIDFTIKEDEIFFGLNAIRDVGKTAARSIAAARGKTPFTSIYDFLDRVNLRKVTIKTFQSLIHAGAFDKLGYSRKDLIDNSNLLFNYVKDIVDYEQRKIDSVTREKENAKTSKLIEDRNELRKALKKQERLLKSCDDPSEQKTLQNIASELKLQLSALEEMKLRRLPALKLKDEPVKISLNRDEEIELTLQQLIEQAHYIGCYVIAHPAQLISSGCEKLNSLWKGQRAKVCGIVNSIKVITTRTKKKMAFMEIDDSTAIADVTIFSNLWKKISDKEIVPGTLLRLNVRVEQEEPAIKLMAENINVYQEN